MPDTLRTRIAAVLRERVACGHHETVEDVADAVIRELDDRLIDFALWLSEELRGEPLSRIDAESCLKEWKWLNDHSRWLRSDDD